MGIYNIDGNLMLSAYDIDGTLGSAFYDVNGTAITMPSNYVEYANGTAEEVTVSASLGTLAKVQSFLVYNNKYYSTDGSSISVQNSSFTLESTKSLSVGHGNGFQLGADGKGYISGWDDQKVYVINLDSVSIANTITLPTTGYTTVAVDTANGYMYILQRGTYPDTKSKYNFIKYDYVNGTIISTVETSKQFGALQSCDFYDNKVYATYGLGTSAIPCGLDVYSTSGELLAEYTLDIFSSTETEGLFVDRATGDILLSLYDKKVYRIT